MASAPPATPESIAKRTASINDAIARVSAAAAAYAEASKKGLGDGDGDAAASPAAATTAQAAQDALVVEARGLLAETQGPIAASEFITWEQIDIRPLFPFVSLIL